jgi:hypothetical protein
MHTPSEVAKIAEQFDDQQWYELLDEIDEVSRRRGREQSPSKPAGTGRDEVAAWLAKKHFIADSSIREVWYLPCAAPPDEIRLLEVNDRLAGTGPHAEAIEFGLDVEGAHFRLFIADVTSDFLDQIKADPHLLPAGWSLDGNVILRRGA